MKNKKNIYIVIACAFVIIATNSIVIYKNYQREKYNKVMAETKPLENKTVIGDQYLVKSSLVIPKNPKDNKKIVLITIDDGPSIRSLDMIKILQKHNAKAIFFINGMHDEANKGVILAEYKAGFPIGNHTWSHLDLEKEKDTKIIDKEIDRDTKLITDITGSAPKFFRPPYGGTTKYVKEYAKKNNMIFMNWSESAKDWEVQSRQKDVFMKDVMDNLQPGAIILIHEHPWTDQFLDELLTNIEKAGYAFADPNKIVE